MLCASKDSLTSWWVERELETAFDRERQLREKHGKQVLCLIPLNLDDYMFSDDWKSPHKALVTKRLAPDFKGWETDNAIFEREIENVIKALRCDDGAREKPPELKL